MTEKTIQKYIDKLNKLRNDVAAFEEYRFHYDPKLEKDINQQKRYLIGIGLFNDLKIPEDYKLVKRLLAEEIKHRNSNANDYEYEVIYMYFYLISEFKQLDDIWEFAKFKFNGTMDADTGFETIHFLAYGKENLKAYLDQSNHELKGKILKKVFGKNEYSDEDGTLYRESMIAYFDFKSPINNPLKFYKLLGDKKSFQEAYDQWKSNSDLSFPNYAYKNIEHIEYIGNPLQIEQAILDYYATAPQNDRAKEQFRRLPFKTRLNYRFSKIWGAKKT